MNKVKKIQKMLAQMPSHATTPVKTQRVSSLERYLTTHYEFRFNLLTEQTEFRVIGEKCSKFQVIGKRELNTLSFEICRNGIKCGIGELTRYLQSSFIEEYHPFRLYLQTLPRWDGKDRLTDLAMRISHQPLWVKGFHRWMLAFDCPIDGEGSGACQ